MSNKKRVLIVDDSTLIRKGLAKIFDESVEFEVVGEVSDGSQVLDAIRDTQPDVVTLDIIMPEVDGLTTLKHIMIESPVPTVMLSSLTQDGTRTTFDALRYGAVDFISKPSKLRSEDMQRLADDVIDKVNSAVGVDVSVASYIRNSANDADTEARSGSDGDIKVIAMGASEGGYRSLLRIIPRLIPGGAAYLAVLYAEKEHIEAFAAYLGEYSSVKVTVAKDGQIVEPGFVYLCAGSDYACVEQQGRHFCLHVSPAPFESRKGSIDRLLFSVAEVLGNRAVGVVLSGSGRDGSEGLEEIKRVGGVAVVQEPDSCLSQGMPAAALDICTPDYVVSDFDIAATLQNDVAYIDA